MKVFKVHSKHGVSEIGGKDEEDVRKKLKKKYPFYKYTSIEFGYSLKSKEK